MAENKNYDNENSGVGKNKYDGIDLGWGSGDSIKKESSPLEEEKTLGSGSKNNLEDEKVSVESKKRKRKKKTKKEYTPLWDLPPVSSKIKNRNIIVGVISSLFIVVSVFCLYFSFIMYPPQRTRDVEHSILGGLNSFESSVRSFSTEFISKELGYANTNKDIEDFMKNMVGTVDYSTETEDAVNIYGNPLIDKSSKEVVKTESLGEPGGKVYATYIDYRNVEIDADKVKKLMSEAKLSVDDVDFMNKLVPIFCKYMNSLESYPLRTEERDVELSESEGVYSVAPSEDVYIDKALFSSRDFYTLLDSFSIVARGGTLTSDWTSWVSQDDEDKHKVVVPKEGSGDLAPLESWTSWNATDPSKRDWGSEPLKYEARLVCSKVWCGSYYLLEEHRSADGQPSPIFASVGNGSLENPAGFCTPVVAQYYFTDGGGNRVSKPIRVSLIEYKVSQDALDYLKSKDQRNRGLDVKSEVQYAWYKFEITNLSGESLTVLDDSTLSDRQGNFSGRTGTMYGLQDSVVLGPNQVGYLESWVSSTELNKKYIIWGAGNNKEYPVIWFRLLAGNIGDPSEDKGVSLNNTRYDESEPSTSVEPSPSTE